MLLTTPHLTCLQVLWDLSCDVAFKRAQFLALEGGSRGPGSSVLVADIPGLEWGTPLDRVGAMHLTWAQVEHQHLLWRSATTCEWCIDYHAFDALYNICNMCMAGAQPATRLQVRTLQTSSDIV